MRGGYDTDAAAWGKFKVGSDSEMLHARRIVSVTHLLYSERTWPAALSTKRHLGSWVSKLPVPAPATRVLL